MGFLDHLAVVCSETEILSDIGKKKWRPMQRVEIKVKMCCDGCERKVKSAVSSIKGVRSVDVNRKQSKVTVNGNVEPAKVLKILIKETGKKAEYWPYVEYNLVQYPYAPHVYDKKAPSGYVRNVVQTMSSPRGPVDGYTTMFSDDNPNACSIM